jgi:hypothetical protein
LRFFTIFKTMIDMSNSELFLRFCFIFKTMIDMSNAELY